MPPKGTDWTSGLAGAIADLRFDDAESSNGAGQVKSWARCIYNLPSEYAFTERHGNLRSIGAQRYDPCTLPSIDPKKQVIIPDVDTTRKVREVGIPYAGLKNIGSTCYLNSLLQYLFVNTTFRRCILETDAKEDQIFRSLQRLFGFMQQSNQRVCDPSEFVDSSGITVGIQEDVTELWQLLMNYLFSRTRESIKSHVSFTQISEVVCGQCKKPSEREEHFCELRVKFHDGPVAVDAAVIDVEAQAPAKTLTNIEELISSCFAEELLTEDDRYDCKNCGKQDARRRNVLVSLPPFLHIVLDRFHWDMNSLERKKVCRPICYPEQLDLTKHISASSSSSPKFDLVGVLEHHSERADSGHYTATLKQPASSSSAWWQLNDSNVSRVSSPGQMEMDGRWSSKSAYMLIYRRCDVATQEESLPLPGWVQEAVDKSVADEKARREQRVQSSRDRQEEDEQMRVQLRYTKEKELSKLSIVPAAWLQDWVHESGESREEALARLDYSDLLLPIVDKSEVPARRFRINPFALWDGRARLVPTEIFRDCFVKAQEEGRHRLIPHGLNLGHVELDSMLDIEVAKTLKELLTCTKALAEVIVKIRDQQKGIEEHSSAIWLRATALTGILQKFSLSAPTPTNRRKKLFEFAVQEVWQDIKTEMARYQKSPAQPVLVTIDDTESFFSSSQKKSAAINDVNLGSDLRCPHGQLMTGFKAIAALRADVDRLLQLADERSRLWKSLGFSVPSARGNNLLPALTVVCETCKRERASGLQQKQKTNRLKEQYPYLVKGELSLTLPAAGGVNYLSLGRHYLVPADWRKKVVEYLENPDLIPPPLETGIFRCVHGRSKVNPSKYFELLQDLPLQRVHPHHEDYALVPEGEFRGIVRGLSGQKDNDLELLEPVVLDCYTVQGSRRLYDVLPGVCSECSPFKSRTLEVELFDRRQASKDKENCGKRQFEVDETSVGSNIKTQTLTAFEMADVRPGQVLLCTTRGQLQIGDTETLEKAFDKKPEGLWELCRHLVRITAELFDEDFGIEIASPEPQAKRQKRDSLLSQSKLAAACEVGAG